MSDIIIAGNASSFADPKDVEGFNKWYKIYLDQGMSDHDATQAAFNKGDNGIGLWGDITSEGSGPSCALIPEDMERFGATEKNNWKELRCRSVQVFIGDSSVVCKIKDRLPHRKRVKHGVVIDLNPDAIRYFGHEPPIMLEASYQLID